MRRDFDLLANRLRALLAEQPGIRVVGGERGPQIVCPTCKGVMIEGDASRIQQSAVPCRACRESGSAA